jgi:hypothetical protein
MEGPKVRGPRPSFLENPESRTRLVIRERGDAVGASLLLLFFETGDPTVNTFHDSSLAM